MPEALFLVQVVNLILLSLSHFNSKVIKGSVYARCFDFLRIGHVFDAFVRGHLIFKLISRACFILPSFHSPSNCEVHKKFGRALARATSTATRHSATKFLAILREFCFVGIKRKDM